MKTDNGHKQIIIGVTGTKAAGKDEFVTILKEDYGFFAFSLGDMVREEAQKRGLVLNTVNLQDIGNELRKRHGRAVLAEMTAQKISELQGVSRIVINGIRNPAEVEFFQRKFGNKFFLVGIEADREIRQERYLKREGGTGEDFQRDDRRDLGEKASYGQQVNKCLELSGEIISNNGTLRELRDKGRNFLRLHFQLSPEGNLGQKETSK